MVVTTEKAPRFDFGEIKSFQESPEGFLSLCLTFSKVGSLVYQKADGSLETEYLTQEELFNEDSLATATGKPITWLHPPEWVNKDNVRKYARGCTGTKIIKDTPFATIVATVHDAELIDVIRSGKAREISAGYTTIVARGDDGKLYQRQRVYNHIAVVPTGRAGSDVRVHYDHDGKLVSVPSFTGEAQNIHFQTDASMNKTPGYKLPLSYNRQHYLNLLAERSLGRKLSHEEIEAMAGHEKPLRYSRPKQDNWMFSRRRSN